MRKYPMQKTMGIDELKTNVKNAVKAAGPLLVSPKGLGPKQLQWCRDNLGNFAKYEAQVLASKGETE